MFKPETNQGFESAEKDQFNSPLKVEEFNFKFVGNATILTSGTFQSPNYERGVRGWCLYANGDVDFPGI